MSSESSQPPQSRKSNQGFSPSLGALNPLGLMDGVLGGQSTDWEPPMAEELESCFPGYTGFEFLDRGGMGAVYSAMQMSLERRVAVKILPPDLGSDAAFVDSFHREARLLARLQHPHIVAVYDFGRNALGHLFIVMEFVEGTSLLEVMKQQLPDVPRALQIIGQVCDALQFAHDHGVVHRDIKPTNILIDVRGRVRVADFGLARHVVPNAPTTTSRTSLAMGTPVYAAPEQRQLNQQLDHRADIFSLGVTFYEMLTGHVPVGVFEPPSKKVACPAAVDKIISRCLSENPDKRYQKAAEVRAAVDKIAARLSQPMIQHTIAKRPIISMMTTVIVTSGFIYLFGELNTMLQQNKLLSAHHSTEAAASLISLDDTFVLVGSRMSWLEARRFIAARPDLELASFHSAAEVEQVTQLLKDRGIRSPLWTGGRQTEARGAFAWLDGTPFDFEHWMPAAAQPPVVVTEVQARNRKTFRTEAGDTPDWIEVYNPGPKPVDLTGWQLRHYASNVVQSGRLGDGSSVPDEERLIAPGQYRIITCYDLKDETSLHFNFQLEAQGARIAWVDPRGNVIQAFDRMWGTFPADRSIVSDASGMTWSWSALPTPGAPNERAGRVLEMSAMPEVKEPLALCMLPSFDGRWCMEIPRRTALPIARRKGR